MRGGWLRGRVNRLAPPMRLARNALGVCVLALVLGGCLHEPKKVSMPRDEYQQLQRDHMRAVRAAQTFLANGATCVRFGHDSDKVCGRQVRIALDVRLQPAARLLCTSDPIVSPEPCVSKGACWEALAAYDDAWSTFVNWWAATDANPYRREEGARENLEQARGTFAHWRYAIDDIEASCTS